jgi:hypothetical protein
MQTLHNLVAAPLSLLNPSNPAAPSLSSALPLWSMLPPAPWQVLGLSTCRLLHRQAQLGFSFLALPACRSASDAHVIMEDVTLLVPLSDYAALLCAALRGMAEPDAWLSGASPSVGTLLSGVTIWVQPSGNISADTRSLFFPTFAGWGWNATGLTVSPDSPIPPSISWLPADCMGASSLAAPPSPAPASGSSSAVAVGVGVGVGGALLLLTAGLVLLLWRRRGAPQKNAGEPWCGLR